MKKLILVMSLFFYCQVSVKANEQLDSLVAELFILENKNDVEHLGIKALLCSDIADLYMELYSDQDYSRTYLLQGVSFVKKKISIDKEDSEDLVLLTDFYRRLALFELTRGNPVVSKEYMRACEDYLKRINGRVSERVSNKAWYEYYHSYFGLSLMTGNFLAGENYLNLAYELIEKDTNLNEFKVNVLSELSVIYSLRGDNPGAVEASRKALKTFEDNPLDDQPLDRFIFFHLRALSYANEYEAIDSVVNSYPHYETIATLDTYLIENKGMVTRAMFESLFLIGEVKRKRFLATDDLIQLKESYDWLRKGFVVAQKLTLSNDGEKIGNVLLKPKEKMINLLSTFAVLKERELIEDGMIVELIEIVDFYQSSRLHLERISYEVNAESWAKEKELKNEIQFINVKIEELGSDGAEKEVLDSLSIVLNQLSTELITVKKKTKREKILESYSLSQEDYANCLSSYLNSESKTLLTYFYAEVDTSVYVFGSNPSQPFFKKIKVKGGFVKTIEDAYHYNAHIQMNLDEINKQNENNKLLYSCLIEPIRSEITTTSVIIYPFNEISYVSFDALLDSNDNYLVNDYEFQYTSSLFSIISNDENAEETKGGRFLSFYPSDYGTDSLAFLLNAQREVDAIEREVDAHTYSGVEASKSGFLKNVDGSKVVHLATHSHLDLIRPYESYIIFDHSADTLDNHLYAYEIFSMTLDADMITLSSCNSAKGELEEGIGVVSLSNAFYFAGIPSTISSLWSAQDKSSSEIMISFYEYLNEGLSKSTSLQKAKIDYLSSADKIKSQPFFWANYVLYGSDDSIYEDSKTGFSLWNWGVGIGGATVLLLLIYFRSSKRSNAKAA